MTYIANAPSCMIGHSGQRRTSGSPFTASKTWISHSGTVSLRSARSSQLTASRPMPAAAAVAWRPHGRVPAQRPHGRVPARRPVGPGAFVVDGDIALRSGWREDTSGPYRSEPRPDAVQHPGGHVVVALWPPTDHPARLPF